MISFKDVQIAFDKVVVLSGFSLDVEKGGHVVLTGPSGSGKSSILKTVTGIVRPSKGTINCDGQPLNDETLTECRKKICYISQKISFDPQETAEDFMMLPFTFKANREIKPQDNEIREITNVFALNYREIKDKLMSELSGGQAQRLAIARGLLLKRDIYLLDEATTGLDKKNRTALIEYFRKSGVTILSVSHDPEWIDAFDNTVDISEYAHENT